MAVGLNATVQTGILNIFRGTNYTAPTALYVKLHKGDPGAAGTANASAVTTRNQLTLAAPSAGAINLTTLASYSMTTSETISHVSIWDSSTAGTFQFSAALTAAKPVNNGDTLTFNTFSVSVTPAAA